MNAGVSRLPRGNDSSRTILTMNTNEETDLLCSISSTSAAGRIPKIEKSLNPTSIRRTASFSLALTCLVAEVMVRPALYLSSSDNEMVYACMP